MEFKELYSSCNFIMEKAPHLSEIIIDGLLKVDALVSPSKDKAFVHKTCYNFFKLINVLYVTDNPTKEEKEKIHQEKVDFINSLKYKNKTP